MNKAKHRFEVELKTCGFVKIEPNVWAYHPDIQIEGRKRVDASDGTFPSDCSTIGVSGARGYYSRFHVGG